MKNCGFFLLSVRRMTPKTSCMIDKLHCPPRNVSPLPDQTGRLCACCLESPEPRDEVPQRLFSESGPQISRDPRDTGSQKFASSYNNSAVFLLILIISRVYEGIFQRLMSCSDITGLLVSETWACISLS